MKVVVSHLEGEKVRYINGMKQGRKKRNKVNREAKPNSDVIPNPIISHHLSRLHPQKRCPRLKSIGSEDNFACAMLRFFLERKVTGIMIP